MVKYFVILKRGNKLDVKVVDSKEKAFEIAFKNIENCEEIRVYNKKQIKEIIAKSS